MAEQKRRKRFIIRDGKLQKKDPDKGKVKITRIPIQRTPNTHEVFRGIPYRHGTKAFHVCPKPLADKEAHT